MLNKIFIFLSINLFDTNAENPELIWNAATRANVRKVLAESQAELVREQLADPTRKWNAVIVSLRYLLH